LVEGGALAAGEAHFDGQPARPAAAKADGRSALVPGLLDLARSGLRLLHDQPAVAATEVLARYQHAAGTGRHLPSHARVVIVGGGIAGCSTAYHLTQAGHHRRAAAGAGRLTSGTTWHAAGLVGQMRPNRNMTRMSRYGIELYQRLEAETGLATGWKQCGSVNVARTPERCRC
jgi:NADPH-dependent 2,4-dienoyl-CoA reductase/sulfur reductase-like enzyme